MSAGPRRIANVGSLSSVNPTIDSYIEKKRAMEERARQIKEERANMKPGLDCHQQSPSTSTFFLNSCRASILFTFQSSIKRRKRDRRSWRDIAIRQHPKITSSARRRHPSRTRPHIRVPPRRLITDTLPQGATSLISYCATSEISLKFSPILVVLNLEVKLLHAHPCLSSLSLLAQKCLDFIAAHAPIQLVLVRRTVFCGRTACRRRAHRRQIAPSILGGTARTGFGRRRRRVGDALARGL